MYLKIWKTSGKESELLRQLVWKDFYQYLMWHVPFMNTIGGGNFQNKVIEWENRVDYFEKWKRGETGFPFIDACMRQLNTTGWMHNRGRLSVANFLVYTLAIDWHWGKKYFATQLVDYDISQNNGNWQWCAGVGIDRKPYLRMYNPYSLIEKYDPECVFTKKWCPELEKVSNRELKNLETGKKPLTNYPLPMVNYQERREKAKILFSLKKKYLGILTNKMDTCFHLDHKTVMAELMTNKIVLMEPPLKHFVEEDGKRKLKIIAFRTNIECGSGAFKKVYLGLPHGNDYDWEEKLVIWSEINLDKFKGEDHEIDRNRIRNEIKIGRLINDTLNFDVNNLVKTYTSGSYKNKKTRKEILVIIQEYINNGTIDDLIRMRRSISNRENPRYLSPEIVNKLLKDILIGLHVLHHNIGIIHRDIKPDNIFIQNNQDYLSYRFENSFEKEYPDLDRVFTTKIGDFGLSSKIPKKTEPSLVFPKITRATTINTSSEELLMGGTPNFTAPEIFSGNYTSKVDIYSLGWTLFSLVSFRSPFVPQQKEYTDFGQRGKAAYQHKINQLYRLDSMEEPDARIMDMEYSKISKEGNGGNSFPVIDKINELFGVNDRYSNPFPLNDYNYLNFFNDCISSPNNRLDSASLLRKYFQIDILREERVKYDPFAEDDEGHYSAFG